MGADVLCPRAALDGLTRTMSDRPALLAEPLLTAAEVGTLLGNVPAKTILQYARDGRLPCVRIGKHVRFVRGDVDRALAAGGQAARR
jgi:excisionase family DNA binding protein